MQCLFLNLISLHPSAAHLGSAVLLIAASYSGCDRIATVTLLTLSVGMYQITSITKTCFQFHRMA